MAEIKWWYVRRGDGKYLVDVTRTMRPLNIENGIGQLTIERKYAKFSTMEKAWDARDGLDCAATCYVTDVPPDVHR